MATKQVALLRGINVGKAKRVAMADLRALVADLGYGDVQTLLNSGNVVFSSTKANAGNAAARIEKGMTERLGVSARITVLTAAELSAIISENPLLDVADNHSRLFAAVLNDPADQKKLAPLLEQDWAPDRLALGPRVAYLWCPNSMLDSKLNEAVNRALRDGMTARNWATMLKLQALIEGKR
ncbi:MAG: DUF1697 domain-containing protein [Minicystis sp.]